MSTDDRVFCMIGSMTVWLAWLFVVTSWALPAQAYLQADEIPDRFLVGLRADPTTPARKRAPAAANIELPRRKVMPKVVPSIYRNIPTELVCTAGGTRERMLDLQRAFLRVMERSPLFRECLQTLPVGSLTFASSLNRSVDSVRYGGTSLPPDHCLPRLLQSILPRRLGSSRIEIHLSEAEVAGLRFERSGPLFPDVRHGM